MITPSLKIEPPLPPYILKRSFRFTVDEAIERATVVSFDVFDTLLRRPFMEPSHLFDALGASRKEPLFGSERRVAEEQARRRHAPKLDVTLHEIYSQFHYDSDQELSFEKLHIYPRPEITEVFRAVKAKGKKVVAVSDMYLPRDFIAELLETHGLLVDDLIVSSHDNVAKWDGSAFRLIAHRHKVAFNNILHFGDNEHADYNSAVALGIRAVLVANKSPRADDHSHVTSLLRRLENDGTYQGSVVGSILRDVFVRQGPQEFWHDIGRYVAAPLIGAFALWIETQAKTLNCERVAFAARDGKLPREAFLALGNEVRKSNAPYVHLSRSVVLRAGLDTRSEIVLNQLIGGVEAPVSDYLIRLGEGVDILVERAKKYFGGDPIVGRDIDRADLLEFFAVSKNELTTISTQAKMRLRRHLEQHDLLRDPESVAIVDIGWGGTTAPILWDTFPETRDWNWLYFGSRAEFEPKAATHRAMFFGYGVPHENAELVFDCVEIVEFLFSAPEPSTISLSETDEEITPVSVPTEREWKGWSERSSQIAIGFSEMLPKIVEGIKKHPNFAIGLPTVYALLDHLIRTDNHQIIREFGRIEHQLGFGASRTPHRSFCDPILEQPLAVV